MMTRTWLPEVIVQLMDRVEARIDHSWSLEEMATEARFSSFHFHRMFREATGETPADFLERLRLERAALLLLASGESITDLALGVGFRRPETFARRFRTRFGVSARDYRSRQFRLWSELGLHAGRDPLGKPGDISINRLKPVKIEIRRRFGEDEGFRFDGEGEMECRYGLTLDWPGITPPGRVRQDWGRPLDGRPLTDSWVRRSIGGGLFATLSVEGSGPVSPVTYQRLFVRAMAGRYRLRPGPVLEARSGNGILVHQPVRDTQEE